MCVSDSSGSRSLSVLIRHAAVTIERKGVGGWRCMVRTPESGKKRERNAGMRNGVGVECVVVVDGV